ncbi:FipA, partial [Enterobacter kobei]
MEQTDKRKQDKLKFDRVINLARRLPQPAIHDVLSARILRTKADYSLPVSTEGQDTHPDNNDREFFFTKIIWAMDY